MKIPKEVIIKNYINQDNHYYYKIDVEYCGDFPIEQIKKRHSDIRKLYKLLLLKYPGCLIPKFESKTLTMKYIMITEEERKQLKLNANKFLNYVITHPILNKTNTVLGFLSKDYKPITNNTSITQYVNEDDNNDNNENADLSLLSLSNESDNKEKKKDFDDFEIIEKEDYKDLFEEEEKNELLGMFLKEENYENKGIISQPYNIIMFPVKYFTKYSSGKDSDNYNQQNDYQNESKIFGGSNLQEKDFEFIKNNQSDLGENFEINNYEKEIMKYCNGIEYLIINYEKEMNIYDKKNKALNNIINLFEKDNKQENKKDSQKEDKKNKDDFENVDDKEKDNTDNDDKEKENKEKDNKDNDNKDNDDEEKDNKDYGDTENYTNYKEKMDMKIFFNQINKMKKYTKLSNDYIGNDLKKTIDELKDYKNIVEGLMDIFIRKKKHIHFLLHLHSQ